MKAVPFSTRSALDHRCDQTKLTDSVSPAATRHHSTTRPEARRRPPSPSQLASPRRACSVAYLVQSPPVRYHLTYYSYIYPASTSSVHHGLSRMQRASCLRLLPLLLVCRPSHRLFLVFPLHLLPDILHPLCLLLAALIRNGHREKDDPYEEPTMASAPSHGTSWNALSSPEIDGEVLCKVVLRPEGGTFGHVH